MSTFGCHNCGVNIQDYADKPYETWPCATCALSKNYSHTFSTGYFDTVKIDEIEAKGGEDEDDTEANLDSDHDFILSGSIPLKPEEVRSLESIRRVITNRICEVFSGILVKLLQLGKRNPVMFEVLIKKMQFPYMSYSDIGSTMSPKCSKQNVLYYLKAAVTEFPELETVIHVDTRYSGGHYALKTLASKRKKELAEQRMQRDIFGNTGSAFKCTDIKDLNKMLKLPFNVRDEVFTFNAYIKDEDHLNGKPSAED